MFLVLLFGLITISHADDNQYIVCSDNNLYKALCNYFGESKIIKKDDEKLIMKFLKKILLVQQIWIYQIKILEI